MAVGRPLGAKIFLEGIEVPFIGATITSSVGESSIAYIDLVPQGEINNIKPRTNVVISVRNYNDVENQYPYVTAWEGEVFGFSFGKTPGSRQFSIQCVDFTGYWDNCLTYFLNPQQSLGRGAADMAAVGIPVASAEKLGYRVQATTGSTSSYFVEIIREALKDKPPEAPKDFLDGFVEVYKRTININQFFLAAEKRLRIVDRMVLKSSGELTTILDKQSSTDWFLDIINQTSSFATLRSVIQDLMSLIFHDYVTVPFPARVKKTNAFFTGVDKITFNPGPSIKGPGKDKYTIGSYAFKPHLFMIPPPMCNVFFPDEYSSFQYSRNFFKEPTRLIYKPELPLFKNLGQPITLPHIYEPPAFMHFMVGKKDASYADKGYVGIDDLQIPARLDAKGNPVKPLSSALDPGFYGNASDTAPDQKKFTSTSYLREQQFLTNEELVKGIWMAQENAVPAATEFRLGISDENKTRLLKAISRYLFYKKRFQDRALQITSHLKISVVPGFTVLVLDDSSANQTTMAYCHSVTHRIYATEGGYTNTTLSYARTLDEQQQATNAEGAPPVPVWFDQVVFNTSIQTELSKFYATLLGDKGSKAIVSYDMKLLPGLASVKANVEKLLDDYRKRKEAGSEDVQQFISALTSRDYVRTRDTMAFVGASIKTAKANDSASLNIPDLSDTQFNEFSGGCFDPKDPDFGPAVKIRQAPILAYRDALKTLRGFRG